MSIVNVRFYESADAVPAASFAAVFAFTASPVSTNKVTNGTASFAAAFAFTASPTRRRFGAIEFRGRFLFSADPGARLVLSTPGPIADTLPVDSFTRAVRGRLSANGVEMPYWRRATYNAPEGSLGASFDIEFAKADLSFIPGDADWKFEIGIWNGTIYAYDTVFDSAKLSTRNLSRSWSSNAPNDSLSFSTLIDIDDVFALAPRKNIICFDTNKTSVDISRLEKLYDTDGDAVVNQVRSFNGLSLYQVLKIAFVEGCGFASFETNIPNYPLTRVDFNILSSYKDSVAAFIGIFNPIFIVMPGNILRILDSTQPIPGDFEPTAITADDYSNLSVSSQPREISSGYLVSYQSSGDYATFLLRVAAPQIIETGDIFDANYTKQTTTETYVDFYDTFYPGQITKSELVKRETTIEDAFGFTISEQTEDISVDKTGKILKSAKSEVARIPLPENGFTGSLKEVRSEEQIYNYQNDITNSRNVILKSIKTTIKAIIATDSDNQYLGNDFKQEYSEAHRAGNLSEDMAYSAFPQPVKTITKIYDQLGNGQIKVTETEIDILRGNFPVVRISETTNGDISINDSFSKPRQLLIRRVGTSKTGSGKPPKTISVGELNLFFALPLINRIIEREDARLSGGSVNIIGYSPDLQRGLILNVKDRDGSSLGKFLVGGFNWTIEKAERGQKVATSLDLEQVI